jgi:hypothetical protein
MGWGRRTAAYLDGSVLIDEIEQLGTTRAHAAMRVADFSLPASEMRRGPNACCPPACAKVRAFACWPPTAGTLNSSASSPSAPRCRRPPRDLFAALRPTPP